MECGSKTWFIPDGYLPENSNGLFVSHEAICVLNTGKLDAQLNITLFFEDRDKMEGFVGICKAERTSHIRMDRIKDTSGNGIPVGVPYAMMVESSIPVIVQYSRMDTSQAELALMTTMAYPGK